MKRPTKAGQAKARKGTSRTKAKSAAEKRHHPAPPPAPKGSLLRVLIDQAIREAEGDLKKMLQAVRGFLS